MWQAMLTPYQRRSLHLNSESMLGASSGGSYKTPDDLVRFQRNRNIFLTEPCTPNPTRQGKLWRTRPLVCERKGIGERKDEKDRTTKDSYR